MASQLNNAYIIGSQNFNSWSQGFDPTGYLKVLPHPDQKVSFKDPFADWQAGRPGNYFSSWGPETELNVTLRMEDLTQTKIDGFGIVKAGDGIIPWLNNKKTPYDGLRAYNGTIPGPLLIAEPGDTINIQMENYLRKPALPTNFHAHGLHVSPVGYGDNVLFSLPSGESWPLSIKVPDNHHLGLNWYHPHLHELTTEQVSAGLAGQLWIAPPYNLPDLGKWNPKEKSMHFMAINTFGIQQSNRPGSATDPLNQDPTKSLPAGTPLQVLGTENGEKVYELSDSVFIGYNAKPAAYDPKKPTGDPPVLFEYGGGPLAEPVENVIHTVNGQYNPTLDLKTGEWNQFFFSNISSNTFHVLQLVKDDGDKLTPQKVTVVGLDGDLSGTTEDNRKEVTEIPLLSSGARISIQSWFEEPGTYYLLSNGTEEILGNNTSPLIKGQKGFADGHLIWGPQVLSTIQVTGNKTSKGALPEPYDIVKEHAKETDNLIAAALNGSVARDRTFTWSSNIGGALIAPPDAPPADTEVGTFQGAFRINGEYWSSPFGVSMVPLAMPMLGSSEIWTMNNESGKLATDLPPGVPNISLTEWHPFHIHQNGFTVLEINGVPVKDLKNTYLNSVLSDTIALPPTYDPTKPRDTDNPYGTVKTEGDASVVKMLMEFKDFPGSFVNHCHILFHEDAGMMAPVRVVLNTKDTWLGLASQLNANGQVELHRANNLAPAIKLLPYGEAFKGGINLAIGDVNYKQKEATNKNVTDNVTDIITVQSALSSSQDKFTIKVFDGRTLIAQQDKGKQQFNGLEKELQITEFNPFLNFTVSPNAKTSLATGDINGDGFSDIVVGMGGIKDPIIEVYSGKNYQLLSRISPFHHEAAFTGTINLAVGDADGDNFEDIIVAQGAGGKGLLEIYSGQLIDRQGSLDGKDTSHKTAMLSDFQPYGASYNGEIKVTSGYVLQRPDSGNGSKVQTYHANITTMAVGNVPAGNQAIKVFTYKGGHEGHGGSSSHSSTTSSSHSSTTSSSHSSTTSSASSADKMSLDIEFTPSSKFEAISGTFADIPGLSRGEPVLYGLSSSGKAELIRLQEKNIHQSVDLVAGISTVGDNLIYGDSGNNNLLGGVGNDSLYGLGGNDQFNGNQGKDTIYGGNGNDTLWGGKDDDLIFGNQGQDVLFGNLGNDTIWGGKDNDFVVGNQGQDVLYGDLGNDSVWGGQDNDQIFGGQGLDFLSGDAGNDSLYGGKDNDTLNGGSGDDWLNGDLGNDVLIGGGGSDRFILASGKGSDTIVDFEDTKDLLVLTNGLTFGQLSIVQGNGATLVQIASTKEVLASLNGVSANLITAQDFVV
jgi:FtsP/CotA-like multicopper oxidase with cupredoxin domain/Ca2+-binding RTX toxin-like protein